MSLTVNDLLKFTDEAVKSNEQGPVLVEFYHNNKKELDSIPPTVDDEIKLMLECAEEEARSLNSTLVALSVIMWEEKVKEMPELQIYNLLGRDIPRTAFITQAFASMIVHFLYKS